MTRKFQRRPAFYLSGKVTRIPSCKPEVGDVYVFSQDGLKGRINRAERLFHLGIPGYIVARVWDGETWKMLMVWGLLPDSVLRCQFKNQVRRRTALALQLLRMYRDCAVVVRITELQHGYYEVDPEQVRPQDDTAD